MEIKNSMKKLLFYILLITRSIHCMQDVHIVPFEHNIHRDAALNVFKKALPQCSVPYALGPTKTNFQKYDSFDLLMIKDQESQQDVIIGLLIYNKQKSTYDQYFADFFRNGSSQVSITRHALSHYRVDWLCIDPKYQSNGYGKFMMNHLEARGKNEGCDLIDLSPLNGSMDFYSRCKYSPRFLTNNIIIAKGLNRDARAILAAISREHTTQ